MTDIAKAYVQIIPSAQGMSGAISNIYDPESEKAGESGGDSFAKKFVSVASKVIATAGIGKIISASLDAGGDLQQSFGGLETIYGDAADAAKNYANLAAQAGISANDYAENAVSFGAALKSAFGGDTAKAAEAANLAIMDMADNSAKFGTDIGAVQSAYQGFAKGNYTMLDNLKLGFGGTKTEMERLLKTAQEITGVEYNIDNLGDVYEAIHVIQDELGVAGVAADEAKTTLSGSFGAMQAAASNFLASLSLGGDVSGTLSQLASATSTWLFGNFLPMIGNIMMSLPEVISTAINTGLPMFLESGKGILTSISEGLVTGLPTLIETGLPLLLGFTEGLRANFGTLVDSGIELLMNLGNGLIQALPTLITYVPQIVSNIAGLINDNAPKLLMAGLTLIVNLVKGLWDNRQVILDNMGNILKAVWDVVTAINWVQLGGNVIKFISDGVKNLATSIPNALKNIGKSAWNGLKGINWTSLGSTIINLIKTGISNLLSAIPTALKGIGTTAWNAFKGIRWGSLGANIISGIISGISGAAGSLFSSLKDLASNALQSAKNFLGIKSPSRVFANEVGKWIPAGIAEGIESGSDTLMNSIDSVTGLATIEAADIAYSSSYTPSQTSTAQLDAILALMVEYFPEMAKARNIDGNALVNGIDRALGMAVI